MFKCLVNAIASVMIKANEKKASFAGTNVLCFIYSPPIYTFVAARSKMNEEFYLEKRRGAAHCYHSVQSVEEFIKEWLCANCARSEFIFISKGQLFIGVGVFLCCMWMCHSNESSLATSIVCEISQIYVHTSCVCRIRYTIQCECSALTLEKLRC